MYVKLNKNYVFIKFKRPKLRLSQIIIIKVDKNFIIEWWFFFYRKHFKL